MRTSDSDRFVVFFIQGDIVVPGNDDLKFSISFGNYVECCLVFVDVTDIGEVAGMEEDVGRGERLAVGMAGVGGGEELRSVGIGNDGEASFDGFGGMGCHLGGSGEL